MGVSDKDALFSREAVILLWNVLCLEVMVLQGLWAGFAFWGWFGKGISAALWLVWGLMLCGH